MYCSKRPTSILSNLFGKKLKCILSILTMGKSFSQALVCITYSITYFYNKELDIFGKFIF